MIKDKTLDKIMESQQDVTTLNCAKKQMEGGSKRLTSKDIGGIFIIHFVFIAVTIMFALWQFKNPLTVSKAEDLSVKAKTVTRKLTQRVFNVNDDDFQQEIDETQSSNTEDSNESSGRKPPFPQDGESTNNDASSEEKEHNHSQVSLKDHEELKKDVKEMKQMMIRLLEKIEK